MTTNKAFLLPVVVDDTREDDENVPDRFRDVQWTRLPRGETSPTFVERVRRLVLPESSQGLTLVLPPRAVSGATAPTRTRVPTFWRSKPAPLVMIAVVASGALVYFAIDKFWIAKHQASPTAAPAGAAPAAFAPPPHSIAVLPFMNMSGDKEQEYFSEGLTEELLNSLSRINELQVAARTSSFSFQGEHPDISTVAHKLNVGAVLEGSVRRSANTVRVTAQLVNGVTGFHLWSETYDRDLRDVLKLQTEIATAVASALKVTMLGDETARIKVGGTNNPAASDAYLRATKNWFDPRKRVATESDIDAYADAIRLDPDYALAYAARSLALVVFAEDVTAATSDIGARLDRAQADAVKAIELAPNLGEGHLALARVYETRLEFTPASEEYERALMLAPGNARVLLGYGTFAAYMGRSNSARTALRRAVTVDPLNRGAHLALAYALFFLGRYKEAIAAFRDADALDPTLPASNGEIGWAYYELGDYESAHSACEKADEGNNRWICLAVAYDKLGRHADAAAELAKLRAAEGNTGALAYCFVFAHWGDTARALDWLETALRLRNPDLKQLKTPMWALLRKEPRFQAMMRELKFPD